jgi:hypothetical protein
MRFVLEIDDRALAIMDVPNIMRAAALVRSEYLGEILRDTEGEDGVPLWDGKSHRTFRPVTANEEHQWQLEHSRNNAEFGLSEDQGLCIWLVPLQPVFSRTFTCRDHWGFW